MHGHTDTTPGAMRSVRKQLLLVSVLTLFVLMMCACGGKAEQKPRIGVAWRSDQEAETYVAVCEAIEEAGGTPVKLEQVLSPDFEYQDNMLVGCKDTEGALTAEAAKFVRCNTWQGSNVEEVMDGVAAVVFPGGEDISPSLYYESQEAEAPEGFSAERDVSDFLLMSYCLENDIPVLSICRGMQVLAVVSGAEMIQDLPTYMESLGADYHYEHRNEPEEEGGYRDFAFHDAYVTDEESLLYRVVGQKEIKDAPHWHHQAVKSVEGTRLAAVAFTDTEGVKIIEAIERPDKTFVLGLQFHPEILVVRGMDESALAYFTAIVEEGRRK